MLSAIAVTLCCAPTARSVRAEMPEPFSTQLFAGAAATREWGRGQVQRLARGLTLPHPGDASEASLASPAGTPTPISLYIRQCRILREHAAMLTRWRERMFATDIPHGARACLLRLDGFPTIAGIQGCGQVADQVLFGSASTDTHQAPRQTKLLLLPHPQQPGSLPQVDRQGRLRDTTL